MNDFVVRYESFCIGLYLYTAILELSTLVWAANRVKNTVWQNNDIVILKNER